ncbi:phospholipase-like protein [Tanacetum coccineum]
MDNMNEVFDAKVTIRETLHTLTSIMNYIFQHEVKQEQNNDVCLPIRYKIGNNYFEFGRQEFCLITGFAFGKIPKVDTFNGLQNSPFCDRVFPDKIAEPLKKVRVSEIYILEMYRNNKFWWKKDPLVIPRGLAWSKISKFEKGDYGALFVEWSNPILSMAPTSTELLQPWLIRSMDYFRTLLFEQQSKQVVESVPVFTSDELVAEYHSITTSVQSIENVGDGDPSIVLKELAAVKQQMNAIERFIKSKNDNLSEDSVAKQSVEKEIESSDGKPDSAISDSIGNQFVQHPLESPNGKRLEISISDVLNGEVSFDKKRPNIYHGESSKNEALSEEFDPKEYDKNVHESVSESEIINVLTGEVSCDKCVGGFYDGESSKLYYTDPKEYPSTSMTRLLQAAIPEQTSSQMLAYTLVDLNLPNLNESFTESQVNEYAGFDFDNADNDSLSDMVKTGEEEIHLDGLELVDDPFVQTPVRQNSEKMSMYVNEVNVVNESQPPSSEKVVEQLLRKRFVGKALVEPYTVQPPTTAPFGFGKRRKRKARMLQTKNTRISFDDHEHYDDVGDDDPDFLVISLEEWLNRKRNKKEPIRQSQIVLKEIPLVEFHEDLSRAPYSRRIKVKFPECIDMVYALGDEISYIFPWGNNDIVVYRSFWLNLLGLNEGGWLSDKVSRYLGRRGTDAKGIPLESYNIKFVVGKDVPIQGDAYGDCGVWVCIFLYRLIHKMSVSAKDPQIVGLAYREHIFDYFWKYKIAN